MRDSHEGSLRSLLGNASVDCVVFSSLSMLLGRLREAEKGKEWPKGDTPFCPPNCDAIPKSEKKSDVLFSS